ncbi:hypothetical protein LAZ67_9003552 [Cordylochernes scorpioides]|uniref:Uncharacterized protein n=1 Tax=Cordylochernes scorpioides TaxID=51811 RepID=A0ABY6KUH0_9ARAC|nr:hypothetical protein LAZ67_9003552 [Cordylochernes scorpioides]
MPKKCCVPGCRSNHRYGDPYVNSFLFPRDESLRKKWLELILREDYTIKKSSVVCIHHFTEDMIIKKDTISKENGADVPRQRLGLKRGAFPTIIEIPKDYVPPAKRKKSDEQAGISNGVSSISTHLNYCEYCDYNTQVIKDLETHLEIHTDVKKYTCPYCDYISVLQTQLFSHLMVHANEKPFKCVYCTYRTLSSTDLHKHTKTHTGEKSL